MSLNTGSIGLLVGCLAAAVAVYFLIIAVFSKTVKNRDEQVKSLSQEELVQEEHERLVKKRKKDIADEPDRDNTFQIIAKKIIPIPVSKREEIEDQFHKAGITRSPEEQYLINILIGLAGGAVVYAGVSVFMQNTTFAFIGFLFGGFMTFMVKNMKISTAVQNRAATIEREMPNVLQLLAIITSAGSGLQQAFRYVAETSDGILPKEIAITQQEMSYGVSQMEALQNMADRNDVDQLNMFVGAVIQSTDQGIAISEVLKSQADAVQTKQRMKLKEKANTISTKMLFPMVGLIFPCILFVILGPAAIKIFHEIIGG